MQLQRERARHHYELHRLDQRVGERLYGSGTRSYMSYMDDVVPVRVNPMPPLRHVIKVGHRTKITGYCSRRGEIHTSPSTT